MPSNQNKINTNARILKMLCFIYFLIALISQQYANILVLKYQLVIILLMIL